MILSSLRGKLFQMQVSDTSIAGIRLAVESQIHGGCRHRWIGTVVAMQGRRYRTKPPASHRVVRPVVQHAARQMKPIGVHLRGVDGASWPPFQGLVFLGLVTLQLQGTIEFSRTLAARVLRGWLVGIPLVPRQLFTAIEALAADLAIEQSIQMNGLVATEILLSREGFAADLAGMQTGLSGAARGDVQFWPADGSLACKPFRRRFQCWSVQQAVLFYVRGCCKASVHLHVLYQIRIP